MDRESEDRFPSRAARVRRVSLHGLGWQFATFLVASILVLALRASGQDAASQIRTETEHLLQSLKDKPLSAPGTSEAADLLRRAQKDLSSGFLYVSLEELDQALDALQGARAVAEKTEAVKSGLPAFESEWEKASLDLTARERETRETSWSSSPVAIRALAETAQGQSIPLLEGGRGFATALGPQEGLFYIGQAYGEAEFAKFCASLNLPRKTRPIPLRSMLPELVSLQQRTNAAFQPPRSIELHPRFIVLNGTLKLAEELDFSRFYAGALYQYLEGVLNYGMLDAKPLDDAEQSRVKSAIVAMRQQLEGSTRDDSIALLFLQRAQSQIGLAKDLPGNADEWKSAQVIVDQVLPAYFAALKPASLLPVASGKTIDITLVRWPYT